MSPGNQRHCIHDPPHCTILYIIKYVKPLLYSTIITEYIVWLIMLHIVQVVWTFRRITTMHRYGRVPQDGVLIYLIAAVELVSTTLFTVPLLAQAWSTCNVPSTAGLITSSSFVGITS